MRKKFIYVLWALVVGVLLVIALIFTAIAKGWIGYVPPIEELENPKFKSLQPRLYPMTARCWVLGHLVRRIVFL